MFPVPSKDTPCIVLAVANAVAVAALPVVSWLPAVFTPGKSILALPLKLTPPIFLAVANVVAVAALPVISLDVKAIVPVVAGSVAVILPLNALWAGACNLA